MASLYVNSGCKAFEQENTILILMTKKKWKQQEKAGFR